MTDAQIAAYMREGANSIDEYTSGDGKSQCSISYDNDVPSTIVFPMTCEDLAKNMVPQ